MPSRTTATRASRAKIPPTAAAEDAMDVDSDSSLSSLSDRAAPADDEEEEATAPPPPTTPAPRRRKNGAAVTPAAPENDASADALAPPTTDTRRRSTRTRKQTVPYSSPPATARRAKRKRPVQDEGEASPVAAASPEKEKEKPKEKGRAKEKVNDADEDAPAAEAADASSSETAKNDSDEQDEDSDEDSDEEEDEDSPDEEELKERRRKSKGTRGKGKGPAKRGRPPAPRASKAMAKPAAKRVKTATGAAAPAASDDNSSSPDEADAPQPKKRTRQPRKKGKERAVITNGDAGHVDEMYEAVFVSDEDHDDVASNWIAKYEKNGMDAMRELVNFILKCCGCDQQVTAYDIEDQDSAEGTLSQVQEAFQKQPTAADYPLTSKKPAYRKFRLNLASFIESLMDAIHTKDLYLSNPDLMEGMQVWIATMSSSTLRQFRHTSTVIALDMMSQMSQIAADIRRANGMVNRQLEAEKKKARLNEARIESMEQKFKEGEERREAVEGVLKDMFDTVFVHRYRDVDSKIRSDCVRELGNWILTLPDLFFDGQYIRYLGWVLSDTNASTRLEVVKALTKLYKKKDTASGLRHFTERFRPRLVEMGTRDADSGVRAAAVELLDEVRAVGYLEPQDIETVGRLLFDSEQKVRRAVVGFFIENIDDMYKEKLEDLGGEEAVLEAVGDEDEEDYAGPTLAWIKLKCLVEVLASYDQEDSDEESSQAAGGDKNASVVMKVGEVVSRFSLAGAVLWDTLDEVRDWEGMAKYLLYDHSASRVDEEAEEDDEQDVEKAVKKAVALDGKEEVILLQVLNASVAGSIVKGPDPPGKKKGTTIRSAKDIERHKEAVSRSLIKVVPQLLKKFGPVPDAASSVLRLEQLMNLDVFQELRQSAAYSALLDEINRQFLTHADEGVLKEASAALMHAKTFDDLADLTDSKLAQLKDETVAALTSAVRGKEDSLATARFSDASLTELINTVRRLEYLAMITDCVELLETEFTSSDAAPQAPADVLVALLQRAAATDDELEEELALRVLKALAYYFMWKLRAVQASTSASSAKTQAQDEDAAQHAARALDDLAERRAAATDAILAVLKARTKVDAVKIAAAAALLDLSTLFAALPSITPATSSTTAPATPSTTKAAAAAASSSSSSSATAAAAAAAHAPLLAVFDAVEKSFAKGTNRKLEPDPNAPPQRSSSDSPSPSPSSAASDDEGPLDEPAQVLLEQRLCEFAAKLVLASIAGVVDVKAWRKRLLRNVARLGPNYKEVVGHLDRDKARAPVMMRRKPVVAAEKEKGKENENDKEQETEKNKEAEKGTEKEIGREAEKEIGREAETGKGKGKGKGKGNSAKGLGRGRSALMKSAEKVVDEDDDDDGDGDDEDGNDDAKGDADGDGDGDAEEDGDAEGEDEEEEEEEEEEADPEELEGEGEGEAEDDADAESEPDPEAEVPPDGKGDEDEEMADA